MTSSTQKENNTMRTTLGGVALLLTIATTATACGGSGDKANPPPTSPATSSSSTTPPDPRSQASAAAQATLTEYFKVTDQLGQDAKVPLSQLKTVAISTELSTEQHWYKRWRSSGWTQTGSTKVTKMQVGQISLDNSNPSQGKVPYVTVIACVDAGATRVTDRSGKQVGQPIAVSTTKYIVANYQYKTDPAGGWRVASSEDEAGSKCAL